MMISKKCYKPDQEELQDPLFKTMDYFKDQEQDEQTI